MFLEGEKDPLVETKPFDGFGQLLRCLVTSPLERLLLAH